MSKKILVIEDDNILQKALDSSLQDAGYEVVQAMDGQVGLEKVKSEKPDLVLLDLNLPKKSGIDVLSDIRSDVEISQTPVLIFSVYQAQEMIAKCVALGIQGYFFKSSYSLEEIIGEIKKVLK